MVSSLFSCGKFKNYRYLVSVITMEVFIPSVTVRYNSIKTPLTSREEYAALEREFVVEETVLV